MSCEKYQDALIDLVASGAEPVGVVRSHLEECASCRSYLEREHVLFATIECGVRQTTNAPLPASLALTAWTQIREVGLVAGLEACSSVDADRPTK